MTISRIPNTKKQFNTKSISMIVQNYQTQQQTRYHDNPTNHMKFRDQKIDQLLQPTRFPSSMSFMNLLHLHITDLVIKFWHHQSTYSFRNSSPDHHISLQLEYQRVYPCQTVHQSYAQLDSVNAQLMYIDQPTWLVQPKYHLSPHFELPQKLQLHEELYSAKKNQKFQKIYRAEI